MTKQNKKPKSLLSRMLGDLKPVTGWVIIVFLLAAGSMILALFAPVIMSEITDSIFNYWEAKESGIKPLFDNQELIQRSITLLIAYLLSGGFSLLTMYAKRNVVSKYFTSTTRIRISDKITRMPVSFVDNTPNGEILSRMMSDVSKMGQTIESIFNIAIQGFMQLIGVAIMMVRINWIMALLVITIVPMSIVLSSRLAKRGEDYYDQFRKFIGKMYGTVEETFGGFDTIKAFNLEQKSNADYDKFLTEMAVPDLKGGMVSSKVQPIISFANSFAFACICIVGGLFAIKGTATVGAVVAIVAYSKMLAAPLENIAFGMTEMQRNFAAIRRVYNFLDEVECPVEEIKNAPVVQGNIEFEHVFFSYSPDKPLIEDLNLSVKAGQKVAIVGPTGGGKTTIVNLLMRFYDVNSGKIIIDGVDATKLDRNKVREMFGMVLQDTWIYSGTIADNIAYGKKNATDEEIRNAAANARINDFIESMPDGYNTMINEEANNISAGQKQLMTIARAYLANKQMLILDEATSNVDTRTELLIQETMDKLSRGKTSFVIAHRLSTIVDADIILVVDNGHIVETGTHDQLLAKNGFYTEIYNSQYDLLG